MPSYLFQSQELVAFARYITHDTLYAFDLDGALASMVDESADPRVPKAMRGALQRLVGLAKVVVITGRSRKEAISLLGFEPHLLIGNHGAEMPDRTQSRNWAFVRMCLKWRDKLQSNLFYEPGIEIEFKGESLSLHYGKAEDPERALARIAAAVEELSPRPRKLAGKSVLNLLPPEAFGKGEALAAAMERLGLSRAVYFGNDETDEEVFSLRRGDVFGIRVGKDDRTAAACYLNRHSEVQGLLEAVVGRLEAEM